nr:Arm DNA-binding domain-containing protein [Bacteroidota bacterium]
MNKSFKSFFFSKKGNGYKEGPMPVYLRLSVNGKRAEMTVQRKCEPLKWNQSTGRAKGTKKEVVQL